MSFAGAPELDTELRSLPPALAPLSFSRCVWLLLLIVFVLAYVAAAVVFGVVYDNVWAVVGYAYTSMLICVRIMSLLFTKEYMLTVFPPRSAARALYQAVFLCSVLVCTALFLYLFAAGLVRYQRWDGRSYFCAMIGFMMAAKWSCFVMIPMYHLRWDVVYPDLVYKISGYDADEDEVYYDAQLNPLKVMDTA